MSRHQTDNARNQWSHRLSVILTPLMCDGIQSIFNKALRTCEEKKEVNEYLQTFQRMLESVKNWSAVVVRDEVARIEAASGCSFLGDMVTGICVSRVRSLSSGRAGGRQKAVSVSVPSLDVFVHAAYINIARAVFKRPYLFEQNIPSIQKSRNDRELDNLVAQMIQDTVWEFIPEQELLRAILSEDKDCIEEITYEDASEAPPKTHTSDADPGYVASNKRKREEEEEEHAMQSAPKRALAFPAVTKLDNVADTFAPADSAPSAPDPPEPAAPQELDCEAVDLFENPADVGDIGTAALDILDIE